MTELAIAGLGQVAIVVKDLARATAFYRDVLRLPLLMAFPNLAFFACGGVRLMLSPPEGQDRVPGTSVLYLKVDDTSAGEAALRGAGVEIVGPSHCVAKLPDHELWMVFFNDSEGNLLALMAEKRTPT